MPASNTVDKNLSALLVMWFALVYFWCLSSLSYASSQFELTEKEKNWLSKHSEILVGVMDSWPPLSFTGEHGQPLGITNDYVAALNKRLGGVLKTVPGRWDQIYEDATKKRLDVLMDITAKSEREKNFLFTQPYLDIPHVIVARKKAAPLANETALKGKTIALESGFGNVAYFQKHFPQVVIKEYRDTRRALGAVASGEADAYTGNRSVALYLMGQEVMTNLKVHGRLRKQGSILSVGIRKDWPIFAEILKRALKDIEREEKRRILSRWVGEENVQKQVHLTEREDAWLKKHPSIRIAFDADYPPYSYLNDEGEMVGIAVDIARVLAVKVGLQLEVYPEGQWKKIYDAARSGEIDVIATLVKKSSREDWFEFTRPYISLSQYIIARNEDLESINQKDFLAGRTVALVKGYSSSELIIEEVPGIKPYYVANLRDALDAVSIKTNGRKL